MSTCHSNNTRHAYESTRTLSKPSRPLRKIVNSLLLTISFLENSFPIGVRLYCATKIQNFFEPVIYRFKGAFFGGRGVCMNLASS